MSVTQCTYCGPISVYKNTIKLSDTSHRVPFVARTAKLNVFHKEQTARRSLNVTVLC